MFLSLYLSFSSLSFYPRLPHIKHCVCKTEFHRRPGIMLGGGGLARPLFYYLIFLAFKRISKRVSDCLGDFSSISETLHLSARKNPMYRKFYLFILLLQLEIFNQDMLFISHLSVILALQRSNETYKYIRRLFRHLYPTHNGNSRFSWNLFRILLIGVICLWLIELLIQSGDIHPKPGPDSVSSIADFSSSSSEISLHTLINHLSIMHLNVQSIVPKMDLIKCEAQAYDILVCSESWLKL